MFQTAVQATKASSARSDDGEGPWARSEHAAGMGAPCGLFSVECEATLRKKEDWNGYGNSAGGVECLESIAEGSPCQSRLYGRPLVRPWKSERMRVTSRGLAPMHNPHQPRKMNMLNCMRDCTVGLLVVQGKPGTALYDADPE